MSDPVQSFKPAPMSARYRLFTGAYLGLVFLVAVSVLVVAELWPRRLMLPVLALMIVATPGSTVLLYDRTKRIEITPEYMRFVRPLNTWALELGAIKGVRMTTWGEMGRPRRLLGTLGLFGYYGLFRSRQRKWYRVMATRPDGMVMVTRRQRPPLVFTPDDPERFRLAIEDALRRRRERDQRLRKLTWPDR